jgi:hypothetical protein
VGRPRGSRITRTPPASFTYASTLKPASTPHAGEHVEVKRPPEQGSLVKAPGVKLEGRTLVLDGVASEELDGFAAPLHVYRRRQ